MSAAGSNRPAHELRTDGGGPVKVRADVVVVGTGPGGAAVGHALATGGAKVLWLEEGWGWQPEQFVSKPSIAYRNLFQERNTRVMQGNAVIPLPGGRGVGGTSLINSAICLRASHEARERWAAYGIPWLAPGAELDGIYSDVEERIQVTKMSPEQVRGNSMTFKRGVDALGWKGDFVSRNAPGCVGCGVCQLGCPSAGKASVDRNFIPDGIEHGADVLQGVRVDRVLVEGGRARGVVGSILVPGQHAPVGEIHVEADRVVVAGSAIGSPLLLQRSNVANSSDQVGRNLHVHPCTGAIAIYDHEIRAWSGAAQGYYVEFPDERMVIETAVATPELLFTMARRMLKDDIRRMNRMALCGVVVRDESSGTVRPGEDGLADIRYHVVDGDRRRIILGLRHIVTVFAAAGALEFHTGLTNRQSTKSLDAALSELTPDIPTENLMIYAAHPQGTCRMGADPKTSVVRPDGRTHDVDGLYVADGSIFPDALGVNPQLTIMAMATHIGRGMVAKG